MEFIICGFVLGKLGVRGALKLLKRSASVMALADVVGATARDKHLSVLPLAQLLEQSCGVFLPILAGAETVFSAGATFALLGGPVAPFVAAMVRENPTTSLLAPSLLARWLDEVDL